MSETRDRSARWQRNRALVAPPGAVELDVPRTRSGRRVARARLEAIGTGTPVVLCASAPFARRRVRRLAEQSGVELARAYLAFPTAASPAYLVEEGTAAVRVFIAQALVVPPGRRAPLPVELGLRAIRSLAPAGLLRLLAPGRIAVGRVAVGRAV